MSDPVVPLLFVLHVEDVLLGRLDLDDKRNFGQHAVLFDCSSGPGFLQLAALDSFTWLFALSGGGMKFGKRRRMEGEEVFWKRRGVGFFGIEGGRRGREEGRGIRRGT